MNLKEAAHQALEALEVSTRFVYADLRPQCEEAITVLRAALAEPTSQDSRQVEPVACHPVAWLQIGVGDHEGTVIATTTKPKTWNPDWWRFEPLYIAPPKREPLTEEQIESAVCNAYVEKALTRYDITIARAIERAHGIGE